MLTFESSATSLANDIREGKSELLVSFVQPHHA
jgi:hypothetical protein